MNGRRSGHAAFLSFEGLGGGTVGVDEFLGELERLPLDAVLGCLGLLSHTLVRAGANAFRPEVQGHYVNLALVDDWPTPLRDAAKRYIPGRTPLAWNGSPLVHEQNLALVAHSALLRSDPQPMTNELVSSLQSRVCRLLLVASDLIPSSPKPNLNSLTERRSFVLDWLRHAQFNLFFEAFGVTMLKMARQRIIMLKVLPKYFDVESTFSNACGVSLQRYFDIATMFVMHIPQWNHDGSQWLAKATLASKLEAHLDEVEQIFGRWIRTPEQYRSAWADWNRQAAGGSISAFDFVLLRQTPLIEARSGELVCPVFPFLVAKFADEPYFLLSEHLPDPTEFHEAVGRAYEEYAHGLVSRIAAGDKSGAWQCEKTVRDRRHGELADSYLQKGDLGLCFEHKGGRPSTQFLIGGDGRRVLGPDQAILQAIESGQRVSPREGKQQDNGFLTRGTWQQSIGGPKLPDWVDREFGHRPQKIVPLITHLSQIRVDDVCRSGYMVPLIEAARLYDDPVWLAHPQWLHVSDLETLGALADEGRLDLEGLIREKATHYPDVRFDIFLFERFDGGAVDSRLVEEARLMMKGAGATFWPAEFQRIGGF
ncbi:MAG: hypothetical protein HY270_05585 [Deltaproteobacteria bacterium]|nr:hypothetical protein [Deltaproteobacteria bacterium]